MIFVVLKPLSSISRIDSGKFYELDYYPLYGAWRFEGVREGTGGLGTFSNMLEHFAEPPNHYIRLEIRTAFSQFGLYR